MPEARIPKGFPPPSLHIDPPAGGDSPDQSPSPGSAEKYWSNLPSTPLNSSASSGVSFFEVRLGHSAEYLALSSSHGSRPLSVSGRIASAGHSGSQTPQSMHSLRLITSMFSPS